MTAVFRKEIKDLLPFLLLVQLVYGTEVFFDLVTDYPDQSPLLNHFSFILEDSWWTGCLTAFFLSFALASGLFIREIDQRTIHFLEGLPTNRHRIFWSKVAAAFCVLYSGPLLEAGHSVWQQIFARTSIDTGFHWNLVFTGLFLQGCLIFVFLTAGMLFSFLRRLGWAVAAVLFATYALTLRFFPAVVVLNPCLLTQPLLEGHHWPIPWRMLAVQLPLGLTALLTSWWLFLGKGMAVAAYLEKVRQSMVGRVVLGCAGTATVVAWLAILIFLVAGRGGGGEGVSNGDAVFIGWEAADYATERYRFKLPSNLLDAAKPGLEQADHIHDQVTDFLQMEAGDPISVNAMQPAGRHVAGLAFWQSIRLSSSMLLDPNQLTATLGHETVHVYADQLSNGTLNDQHETTRFFNEGLAEYLEQRYFRDPAFVDQTHYERVVAAFDRFHRFEFDTFMSNSALVKEYDAHLVYPFGMTFVKQVIDRHGDDAANRILTALGRDDRPRDLAGLTLWRDAFQQAGMNFDAEVNNYYERVKVLGAQHAEFVDALPRLYGSVTEENGILWVTVESSTAHDHQIVVRARQSADTEQELYQYPDAMGDGRFPLLARDFPNLELQVGLQIGNETFSIWEKWVQIQIGR
ncbi:ABC transporter permease [Acanthopleuribacter pedis]|uniref:ABC transporter permease n=1 Tax=Acanthopleuribacter pedis TaxID=442870 RepID=A0A8J7Q5B6_9BACT|nr:ABC transporter permease [Acanthopleuribacter pedis]MBO1316909.1 ABC transporter permease [Acanthopleuribacter pedis]